MAKTKKKEKKCKCRCRCKNCGKTKNRKKIYCKKCVKKGCKCCVKRRTKRITKRITKRRTKRKYKKAYKNIKRYKQSGCSKQRGGNYKCSEATNMGSIYGGNKLNLLTRDITRAQSTQNKIPGLVGGGLAINAGLGKGIDVINSISNSIKNTIRTSYGDHHVQDSDVTVAGDIMKKSFGQ